MVEITFTLTTGETEFVRVDAVVEEMHRSSAVITSHPVEDGGNVSDNVRPDQDTIQLQVFVSNTPITVPEGVSGGVQEQNIFVEEPSQRADTGPRLIDAGAPPIRLPLGGLVPGLAPRWEAADFIERAEPQGLGAAQLLAFDEEFDRVNEVYIQFLALLSRGIVVRVVTKLRTYENMLIEELTVPRKAETGNAARMDVTLRQVRIVDTQTVEVPPLPEEDRGENDRNRGGQATDDADGEEGSRSSLWMRGARRLGLI